MDNINITNDMENITEYYIVESKWKEIPTKMAGVFCESFVDGKWVANYFPKPQQIPDNWFSVDKNTFNEKIDSIQSLVESVKSDIKTKS